MKYFIIALILVSKMGLATVEKKDLTFGAFIDSYYAYDFNRPTQDRNFTTQAARHNEFSINLAYVEAKLEKERVHGRLALQAGTSVYANYVDERNNNPALGNIAQYIQEAYGGYRLAEGLWLDAGIFLSHIGAESFISRDNWNYTRSLAADYSPYYQAGFRLSYQWSPQWSASLHLLNGWQKILETNSDKAVGMQIAYSPSEDFSVTYNNFIGQEQKFRFFNNFIFKVKILERLSLSFSSDIGFQKKPSQGYSVWYVETLLAQFRLTPTVALGGRVEYFSDKDQVVVTSNTSNGFRTVGASLNIDWQPDPAFLLRNEVRSLFSKDAVFNGRTGAKSSDTLFVTSIGVSF